MYRRWNQIRSAREVIVETDDSPWLPIDIWCWVIDLLHPWADRRTLVACALTCRAWLPRCRHRLSFDHRVSIHSDAGLDGLMQALCDFPELQRRIDHLDIYGGEHYNTALIIRTLLLLGRKLSYLLSLSIYAIDFTHGHIHLFFKALSLLRPHLYLCDFYVTNYRFSRHSQLVRCAYTTGAANFDADSGISPSPVHARQRGGSQYVQHLDTLWFRDLSRQSERLRRLHTVRLTASWMELGDMCQRLRFDVSGPRKIKIKIQPRGGDDLTQIGPTLVPAVVEMIEQFCSFMHDQRCVSFSLPYGGVAQLTQLTCPTEGEHSGHLLLCLQILMFVKGRVVPIYP